MIFITYLDFINNILETRGRFNCGEEYHERHHIIPKCLGGNNDQSNLIDLFAKEHFIAHKLLALENPSNISLTRAYAIMAFVKNDNEKRYELTPEEYEEARKTFSNNLKNYYEDKTKHPCYGTHISQERKEKISKINKGNKYCVGRVISEETRKKISEANKRAYSQPGKYEELSKLRKGKGLLADNPNAKSVVRLSDGKIYDCMKIAALENNVNYSTFKTWVHKGKNFIYYSDWIKQQNLEEQ